MTKYEHDIELGIRRLAKGVAAYVRKNQHDNHLSLPWTETQLAGSIPHMERELFLALAGRFATHFENEDHQAVTLPDLVSKGHTNG